MSVEMRYLNSFNLVKNYWYYIANTWGLFHSEQNKTIRGRKYFKAILLGSNKLAPTHLKIQLHSKLFTNKSYMYYYLNVRKIDERWLWCNGLLSYENGHGDTSFKSWTRLITFHIALIPLGKIWIQLFSLQLWVNSRAGLGFFSLGEAN